MPDHAPLTPDSPMTDDERAAVAESARRMREWREKFYVPEGRKNGRKYQTGRSDNAPAKPRPVPCQPIVDLEEAGQIDAYRDAKLTALVFRISLNGEDPGE